MKQYFYILFFLIPFYISPNLLAENHESNLFIKNSTDRYIKNTYDQLHFRTFNKLNYQVFKLAFIGYLNMIEAGKISHGSPLTVCDFSLSSNAKRLWIIDIQNKKVVINTLVAHGQGSGEEFANTFSNIPESHQSSLGFYVTGDTYQGNHGYSLKLHGIDGEFNSNAYDRAIVIHGASYVCQEFAKENKRIGRSFGCPALPEEKAPFIIDMIKEGTCLFIYAKSNKYINSSYWVNHQIQYLPEEASHMDLVKLDQNSETNISRHEFSQKANLDISSNIKEEDSNILNISEGDKNNYKVNVETIIIKKSEKLLLTENNTSKK